MTFGELPIGAMFCLNDVNYFTCRCRWRKTGYYSAQIVEHGVFPITGKLCSSEFHDYMTARRAMTLDALKANVDYDPLATALDEAFG